MDLGFGFRVSGLGFRLEFQFQGMLVQLFFSTPSMLRGYGLLKDTLCSCSDLVLTILKPCLRSSKCGLQNPWPHDSRPSKLDTKHKGMPEFRI